MFRNIQNLKVVSTLVGILLVFFSSTALSIPSFSRQTNLPCSSCHYKFPELNTFGRLFKLNAYTITTVATIKSTDENKSGLQLLNSLPVSVSFQTSYTSIASNVPDEQNNVIEFPQELGIYLAGAITPHIGAFVQISYEDQEGTIGLDMTDIRYANHTTISDKDLLYGVSLNNAPTMQDVWNTVPMWSYPFTGSGVAPTPMVSTVLESMMNVMGFGAYALYNNLIYAEISTYRSVVQGGPIPPNASSSNTISSVAPYWRLALQHQWGTQYIEVGTYGIAPQIYPDGITGEKDKYTDLAFDAQYENSFNSGSLIAHANYIYEKQNLDATHGSGGSANASNVLNSLKVDAGYNFNAGYSFTVGYFNIKGDNDNKLYVPDQVEGSNTGSPNSNGFTLQATLFPWFNTQFALQYVMYNKFNGSSDNYDGSGRNASDNNTLYANVWLMF
ncbi:hypothetical protein MNBD_IGNAVI01-1713 [hydrothermal vent metagenome]|uniref:Cytochrome C n=1 Tax=hydrothermal vent metagenome TaxID=652676 RepID=A0A3B1BX85_9ZZZZ